MTRYVLVALSAAAFVYPSAAQAHHHRAFLSMRRAEHAVQRYVETPAVYSCRHASPVLITCWVTTEPGGLGAAECSPGGCAESWLFLATLRRRTVHVRPA